MANWIGRRSRDFPLRKTLVGTTRELISSVDAILLGRRAYEKLVSYWLSASLVDPVMRDRMNTLPKFVFSRTLNKVEWGEWDNARLVTEDAEGEVKRMKQEEGKDLVIYGSGDLVSSLTRSGLIDEYQLLVRPILLGRGIPQFKNLGEGHKLGLVKTVQFKSGLVFLCYRPLRSRPGRIYLPKIPGLTPQLRAKAKMPGFTPGVRVKADANTIEFLSLRLFRYREGKG